MKGASSRLHKREGARPDVRPRFRLRPTAIIPEMDGRTTHVIVEDAALCGREIREVVEGLPAQTFGGDLSRDFIVEGCNR